MFSHKVGENILPFFIYTNNAPRSALVRDFGDCRDNKGKFAKRVFACLRHEKMTKRRSSHHGNRYGAFGVFVHLFCTLLYKILEHRKRVHALLRIRDRTGHALRMPLYGPDRKRFMLDRFCEGVTVGFAPCDRLEAVAEFVECLVVVAVYFHGLSVEVSENGITLDAHRMADSLGVVAAELSRDILGECAAEVYV